jgi:hypothetical protein
MHLEATGLDIHAGNVTGCSPTQTLRGIVIIRQEQDQASDHLPLLVIAHNPCHPFTRSQISKLKDMPFLRTVLGLVIHQDIPLLTPTGFDGYLLIPKGKDSSDAAPASMDGSPGLRQSNATQQQCCQEGKH